MGYSPNPKKLIEYNNLKYNAKKGWCYEGIHCRNKNCNFKHRNEPVYEEGINPNRSLISSIRGPRQHSKTSSAICDNI